ncbi:MAG: hypothetical protein KAY24_13285 [Candidatus Eisenbacteria sp.]|nr:hypothetical protein [Candidatus Eisenbacteria bacterium]
MRQIMLRDDLYHLKRIGLLDSRGRGRGPCGSSGRRVWNELADELE